MSKHEIAAHKGQYALALTLASLAKACHLRVDDTAFALAELGLLMHRRSITMPAPSRKRITGDEFRSEDLVTENGQDAVALPEALEAVAEEWDGVEVVICKEDVERLCVDWNVRDKPILDEQYVLL